MDNQRHLSKNQKAYLEVAAKYNEVDAEKLKQHGVSDPSYLDRPDLLEEKIRNHIETLPEGLDVLFNDIEHLWSAGYLPPTEINQEWVGFYTREDRNEEEIPPVTAERSCLLDRPQSSNSVTAALGGRLGSFARHLVVNPRRDMSAAMRRELVAGFAAAVYGESIAGVVEPEELQNLSKIFENEAEHEIWGREHPPKSEVFDSSCKKIEKQVRIYIKRTLEENELEYNEWTLEKLEYEFTCPPWVTAGDVIKYFDESQIRERIPKEKIIDSYNKESIAADKMRKRLKQRVYDDWKSLREESWSGITAVDVLSVVSGDGPSIRKMAEELANQNSGIEKAQAIPAIARLCECMSGERSSQEGWGENPIVRLHKIEDGSLPKWQIELTPYGSILKQYQQSPTISSSPKYGLGLLAIDDDEIKQAVQEFD